MINTVTTIKWKQPRPASRSAGVPDIVTSELSPSVTISGLSSHTFSSTSHSLSGSSLHSAKRSNLSIPATIPSSPVPVLLP